MGSPISPIFSIMEKRRPFLSRFERPMLINDPIEFFQKHKPNYQVYFEYLE